jgi:hypothetical protein
MLPLTNPVRQLAYGEDVAGSIKEERIGLVQAFTREDFIFDRKQARVVGLEWVRSRHCY